LDIGELFTYLSVDTYSIIGYIDDNIYINRKVYIYPTISYLYMEINSINLSEQTTLEEDEFIAKVQYSGKQSDGIAKLSVYLPRDFVKKKSIEPRDFVRIKLKIEKKTDTPRVEEKSEETNIPITDGVEVISSDTRDFSKIDDAI